MNEDRSNPRPERGSATVAVRALVVVGVLAAAYLIWSLSSVLLLVFAALLVAVILRAAADGLRKLVPLPEGLAIAVAALLILAMIAGIFYLFGAEVSAQTSTLLDSLPRGIDGLRNLVGSDRFDQAVEDLAPSGSNVLALVQTALGYLTSILSGLLLAILGGIYLTIDPRTYRKGLAHLIPHRARPAVMDAVTQTGATLRYWLLGQLASMLGVGLLTYIGLSIIGVPSPLALGLIAGLLDFVPLVGPFVAAIPGVLIALTLDVETAAITVGMYLVIQQIEGNLFQPIFMKKAVDLPPAMTLFGLFMTGTLFGPIGVVLGGPLIVAAFVMVRKLWVERAMREDLSEDG